jgi:murein DD-endopeptidase MepM/ murein hydrolase activator NlpD
VKLAAPLAAGLAVAACAGPATTAQQVPAAPNPLPAPVVAVRPAPPPVLDTDFRFRGALAQGGMAVGQAPAATVRLTLDGRPLRVDAQGRFLIAFGRDHVGTATIEATLRDGTRLRSLVPVAPRTWRIERIPSLKQNLTPNPVYDKLREGELSQIRTARAQLSDATGWTERFIWPATGRVSGVYGSQRILGGVPMNFHGGVDVAQPAGTPVVAPASGVIALAAEKPFSLEGNLLIIDHGNQLFSAFLHLSRIDVKVGDRVAQGQRVGAIGRTGRATGPHLHWGLTWGELRIDPELLVPPMRPDAPLERAR